MAQSARCVARIVAITGRPVQRIVLTMPSAFRFRAGQYLTIDHPQGGIPLSIASAPWRLPELHLHYRSTPEAPEAERLDGLLASRTELDIAGPDGNVALIHPLPAPVLLVAGGTGIAQILSILDDLRGSAPAHRVTVLWCVDDAGDFYAYAMDELNALRSERIDIVLRADPNRTAANAGMAWLRAHGRAFRSPACQAACQIVLAGGPAFVYAASDALRESGVPATQLQSDVFAYAPRPGSGKSGSSRSA
jgi:CDP-4-dehydro-6-deoxyglucose reductase, E3